MSFEIIAEIHPQHGGSLMVAREMIRQAKLSGADVAKFQLYDAEKLLGHAWKYLELSWEDTALIKRWCDEEEIEFMASVFDEERLEWCERLNVGRYKIASPTVKNNRALCERILNLDKETIVSLGHWTGPEKPFGEDKRIHYLYCKSKYPALLEDMRDFPADFPAMGLAGFSDHTLGIDLCLLSIARGARIIEKHMTMSKMQIKDTEKAHICSMTPEELADLRWFGGSLYRTNQALKKPATI
jgi:N,N'-diacetyllegionaminate synthase